MSERRLSERLVALFVAALLLFAPPLVALWPGGALGVFAVWMLVVAALAVLMERRETE